MRESEQPVELLSLETLPGHYTQLRFRVPPSLANPQPGRYCRISNGNLSGLMPIMRVKGDVLECLYRNGHETPLPERLLDGRLTAVLQGNAWKTMPDEFHTVFLAQNEGLASVVHAAERLHYGNLQIMLTAFLEFDDGPPFTPKPSQILLPGLPPEALACAPLLEDWGIASRLADPDDRRMPRPGWFSGTAVRLTEIWLENTVAGNYRLVCCGTQRFVDAVSNLADRRGLPVDTAVLPI
ncbi:MAG TPA: hypothetical protein VF268_01035 [Gammaproteobacteria bacterium]|jgi:dihydroorotate dehydrogenase electron transfer subunit